jgi:hypothetical protein
MKNFFLALAVLFSGLMHSQTVSFNPKTGDVEMDGFLKSVNDDAQKDLEAFKNKVVTKFNVAKTDVDKLLKDMHPGDVYMAAQVSNIVNKPLVDVSTTYNKNKDKGWGAIAKEMGIKPGSPEFHKLKQSMKKNGNGHGGGEGKDDDKDGEEGNGNGHGHGNGHGKGHGKK